MEPDRQNTLLHMLASCGFVGNAKTTADTGVLVNPPDLERLDQKLLEFYAPGPPRKRTARAGAVAASGATATEAKTT